jgi:peroxisomal membrane protein 4
MTTIKQIHHHAHAMDAFWAGLVAGYVVFGRNVPSAAGNTIAQQMALYVLSRIILGGAKYITKNFIVNSKGELIQMSNTGWTILASFSWAIVMYLFRADPTVLQSSMLHSMKYLYEDSESWSGLTDFLLV